MNEYLYVLFLVGVEDPTQFLFRGVYDSVEAIWQKMDESVPSRKYRIVQVRKNDYGAGVVCYRNYYAPPGTH